MSYTGLRLEPVSALGVNYIDTGTVHWNAAHQFFYPVGGHIRHYNLETNQSQFLFPERFTSSCLEIVKICDVNVSPKGQFIAISEIYRPNYGILSIYDFETQVAHVHLRHDDINKFVSLSFTSDSSMIAALGMGTKENRVFVWKMGRQVSLAAIIPVSSSVTAIAFEPQDSFRLILFGKDAISSVLINTIDKQQTPIEVSGLTSFDRFCFVPSIPGMLLVSSANFLAVIMDKTVVDVSTPADGPIDILRSARHFVYIVSGKKTLILKASAQKPYLTQIAPIDLTFSSISEFSPSPDGDQAIVFHDDSFVGIVDLLIAQKAPRQEVQENQTELVNQTEMNQFIGLYSPLPIRFHVGPIVAIATCPRKPLLATCGGQDRTLLVWNLAKKSVIASVKLAEPVNSCSFHPSGDLLAVGTSEKLLLYSLTFDSLVLRTKWDSLSCTCVSFSNGGHLLAAGALIIRVIATYSAKTVTTLRGHNSSVKSISWAPNDAFFISSGIDGNVFKWSARTWDRSCEVSLASQCVGALLSPYSTAGDEKSQGYNILVATSNNTIYDMELNKERAPKRKLQIASICLPVHFSIISGDQRGDLQVIPYPLLPAGEANPFHIGMEVAVHTGSVHCIVASSDGMTLFTASEDSSIFIFNIVQPHQMVIASPVALALTREEQSFLIERVAFEERKETLYRLREMLNLHRSQFQCSKTKLSEAHSREIVQQKNKWQMTLCSLKKQVHALAKQKKEQEKKAAEVIADSDSQNADKIKTVKALYEEKLTEQTRTAAELMKEKIRIQCEYEEKIHVMTEEYKTKLQERRESAEKDLKTQGIENEEARREFKQVAALQEQEVLVLKNEHEMEVKAFKAKMEAEIENINSQIDRVRTELVGKQDTYDGNEEQTKSYEAAIERTTAEKSELERMKESLGAQIKSLREELAARGERVGRQTNNLLQLKGKNDELQKWRTVMDFRLNEFKSKEEPKSREIETLRQQIQQNESLLRSLKLSNAKDTQALEQMEESINSLYNEILKEENLSQKCEAKINQFKNAVHAVYTEVDPEQWANEIKRLHDEFVTNEEMPEEDQALEDTFKEFERHKSALAEKVVDLRTKVEEDGESSGFSFLKQIGRNQNLIDELTELRNENKKLKTQLHYKQTEMNSLLRQCSLESKQLETKVRTMLKSTNIICQPVATTQRKVSRSGIAVDVEHFS